MRAFFIFCPYLAVTIQLFAMDIQFNKNEDVMKMSLSEMRKRLQKIYEGGGKKSIEKQSKSPCTRFAFGLIPHITTSTPPLINVFSLIRKSPFTHFNI